jgi:hypothetical protein
MELLLSLSQHFYFLYSTFKYFFQNGFIVYTYIYTAIYTYIVVKKICKQNKNQQECQQK